MCALRPALTLEEAYRNLDPIRPLREEWFEAFYVPRPEDGGIEKLLDELNLDDSENDKTLFSGQQGAGESTELYRLYRELQSTHIPILLNVEETLNLGDVHYTDLLVMLGLRAYQEARACGIRADEQHARDLLFWYRDASFFSPTSRSVIGMAPRGRPGGRCCGKSSAAASRRPSSILRR
jgi:hypothetical protein